MAVERRDTLQFRIEHALFKAYTDHYAKMPLDKASDAGAKFGALIGPLTPTHRVARNNLRLAFPTLDTPGQDAILKGMWNNLGRLAGEFPHLHEIGAYARDSRIEVVGAERLDAVRESGKGAVFISGHFANWEIMAAAIVQRGVTCHVTYRAANNPFIDDYIVTTRSAYGVKLQAAKGTEGGIGLLRALAKGETIAIMNDQKYNQGLSVPLFGYDAMTADAPSRLALRYGVPLIPLSIRRLQGAYFQVTVHEALPLDRSVAPEEGVASGVALVNAFIEARIRECPEQWFWVHKRWPKEAWVKAGII